MSHSFNQIFFDYIEEEGEKARRTKLTEEEMAMARYDHVATEVEVADEE